MAEQGRLAWVDCAKGIGITLVVYGHIQRGVIASHIADDSSWFMWVDYTLYLSHMPLFFVLSGLFIDHSIKEGKKIFSFQQTADDRISIFTLEPDPGFASDRHGWEHQ